MVNENIRLFSCRSLTDPKHVLIDMLVGTNTINTEDKERNDEEESEDDANQLQKG